MEIKEFEMNKKEIREIAKKVKDVTNETDFDRAVDDESGVDEREDDRDICFRVSEVEMMDSEAPMRNNPPPPMV